MALHRVRWRELTIAQSADRRIDPDQRQAVSSTFASVDRRQAQPRATAHHSVEELLWASSKSEVPAMPSTTKQSSKASSASFPALKGDHWIEPLRDGTRVLIRPLQGKDRPLEEEFIRNLSSEARRYRFLCDFKEPSMQLLNQLMHVDYERDMAFVALAHDDGHLREVGVSRYAATKNGNQCECAVTVADNWRHRGLAVLLMQHLIDVARKNKFTRMFSIDDNTNEPMRELAHFLGFKCESNPDDPRTTIYSLAL